MKYALSQEKYVFFRSLTGSKFKDMFLVEGVIKGTADLHSVSTAKGRPSPNIILIRFPNKYMGHVLLNNFGEGNVVSFAIIVATSKEVLSKHR